MDQKIDFKVTPSLHATFAGNGLGTCLVCAERYDAAAAFQFLGSRGRTDWTADRGDRSVDAVPSNRHSAWSNENIWPAASGICNSLRWEPNRRIRRGQPNAASNFSHSNRLHSAVIIRIRLHSAVMMLCIMTRHRSLEWLILTMHEVQQRGR